MSNLISRQAAIDLIRSMESDATSHGISPRLTPNHVINGIESLPSADRPTGEWIPCSEERPKFPCLACDVFEQIFIPVGIVTVGKLYYDGLQFNGNVEEFLKGEKTGYGARVLPRKIVAWMPLPEPYKEK